MSRHMWKTKADVDEDLAKITGRRFQNIDNGYIIVGKKPPPIWTCDNDLDELNLRFGDFKAKRNDEVTTPDLIGIKEMLRVVNDYSAVEENKVDMCSTPQCRFNITISKLNPNVKEFIPNAVCDNEVSDSRSRTNVIDNNKTLKDNKNTKIKIKSDNRLTNGADNVKGNLDSETPDSESRISQTKGKKAKLIETKDKANQAEDKVSETVDVIAQTDKPLDTDPKVVKDGLCTQIAAKELKKTIMMNNSKNPQMKKAKNIAIANLQKLFSIPNENMGNNKVEKAIKLITPDFYEKSLALDGKDIAETEVKGITDTESFTDDKKIGTFVDKNHFDAIENRFSSPKDFEINITKPTKMEVNSEASTSASPQLELKKPHSLPEVQRETPRAIDVNKINISDPQIQDSIKKVSNWLNKSDKHRKPEVFLSPVTFKRKENRKNSPTETDYQTVKRSNQCATEQYKPSKYAAELTQMYTARLQEKKKKQKENVWANLDVILKEKDEQIRKARSGECFEVVGTE